MLAANTFHQNNLIQVDLDLVQHSCRTAALAFAVVGHHGPLLRSGDGALLTDVMTALNLSESPTRRMLAKLEAIGLVWSEQPDPCSPKKFFTNYTSFGQWKTEQEYEKRARRDAPVGDLANETYQANSDREVLA
jgi:hypothetical protein